METLCMEFEMALALTDTNMEKADSDKDEHRRQGDKDLAKAP